MAENKIFAHTPEEVEALINKEGIEYVSVRFTDLIGVQQHFTVPASEFIDNAFTDGMPFDGSSVQGFQAINESDMKLIPDVTTAFVDPFRKHKTLDVAFSIVDPLTDEPYSRDPRQVAGKAEAYLKSTGIADTASFAPEAEFFIFDKVRYENSMQRGTPESTPKRTAPRTSASRTASRRATSRFRRATTTRTCATTWSPTCRRSACSWSAPTTRWPAPVSRRSTTASTPCSTLATT